MAFVHGDNQYGFQRALALLEKEGFVLNDKRQRKDIPLVHAGDNGDYYHGTALRDQKAWEMLPHFYDDMLIGNHEGAVLFGMELGGFSFPNYICSDIINAEYSRGRLKFAVSYDGFLITHAGVHPMWEAILPDDPEEAAKLINDFGRNNHNHPLIANIGARRGGGDMCGGILWRDASESISDKWPQIFGHSRLNGVTKFKNKHYGIDVGYPDNGRIAGIYTDDIRAVEVNINE